MTVENNHHQITTSMVYIKKLSLTDERLFFDEKSAEMSSLNKKQHAHTLKKVYTKCITIYEIGSNLFFNLVFPQNRYASI